MRRFSKLRTARKRGHALQRVQYAEVASVSAGRDLAGLNGGEDGAVRLVGVGAVVEPAVGR
ncbi:hypothetical protein LCGC14_2403610, partial [marine sediment metagenome]